MALKHLGFAFAATIMASNAAVAVAQDTGAPVTTTEDDDDDEGKMGLLGLLGLAGLLGLKRRDRNDHHTTTTNRH